MSLEKSDTQFRTPNSELSTLRSPARGRTENGRTSGYALWLALFVTSAMSVHAQVGSATSQSENANTREQLNQNAQMAGTNSVPQFYEGEESDVGPQSVVAPQARQTTFQAKVDEQLLYTDNALLTPQNKISSGVLISTAQFALAPTPIPAGTGTLSPRLGYQAQWFDYLFNDQKVPKIGQATTPFNRVPELSDFDFNAQSVFADALWTHEHLSLGGGLELTRMFSTSDYESFYEEEVPYWSARYVVPVNDKAAFSAGYLGDYRFTSTKPNEFLNFHQSNVNDRTDHGVLLTWTEVLCKHAVFQPFYQFKYTRFTEAPVALNPITRQQPGTTRNDYLNTVGAGLYWFVCPNCTIRGFVNYNILSSSVEGAEYREFDGGGGIDLSVKF